MWVIFVVGAAIAVSVGSLIAIGITVFANKARIKIQKDNKKAEEEMKKGE